MRRQKLDPTVEEYLSRLGHAAAVLPADRRTELMEEIRAHARAAVEAGERPERVIAELGDPADVIEAAQSEPTYEPQFGALEVRAILFMALTLLLSVFAWLAGAIFAARSTAWTLKQKLIGVVLLPWASFALSLLWSGEPPPGATDTPLMTFYWLAGRHATLFWIGGVYLYRVHPARIARQRAKQAGGSVLHRSLGDSFTLRR